MKIKKIIICVFFIGIFLNLLINQSIASYAITEAKLDWGNMILTGDISWISQYTNTSAYVENDLTSESTSDTQTGWVSSESNVSISEANATGVANSFLSATTSVGPYGQLSPYGDSTSNRWGDFKYTGSSPGYVTVSIPFTLSFTLSASTDPDAFAYGYLYVWGDLFRGMADGGGGTHFWQNLEDYATPGQYIEDSISGTLNLRKMFYPGDIGNLDIGVLTNSSAYSAIPIPSTILLLMSGLLSLVGLRRFKSLR